MKIYMVHCGYYDLEIQDGIYEMHANFIVAAESFTDARAKVKLEPDYARKKMHVDGLVEINAVNGFRVHLEIDEALKGASDLVSSRHRDLAPKASASPA